MGLRLDAEPHAAAGLVRLRHRVRGRRPRASCAHLYRELPFFRTLVDNLEMTLAKSSLEVAREYLELVPPELDPERLFGAIADEHARTVSTVLEIVGEERLLERHPVVRRSIGIRNPYVDPMNAIQVELLRRFRAGDEDARLPLMRSIAGIAAALRNTVSPTASAPHAPIERPTLRRLARDAPTPIPPQRIWDGILGRAVHGEQATLALLELDADTVVPEHSHANEQLGILRRGLAHLHDRRRDARARARGRGGSSGTCRTPSSTGPEGAVVVEVFAPRAATGRDRAHDEPRRAALAAALAGDRSRAACGTPRTGRPCRR